MEIKIKNMVCRHCVATVGRVLSEAGFVVTDVRLGSATVTPDPSAEELSRIATLLSDNDFELIADPETELVESVKRAVIDHVRNIAECRLNLSACIAEHLNQPYDHLSRVFSRVEGRTIEKYHALQRIERVKELLEVQRHTLAEIADMTGFSSAAHLSRNFKQLTGLTTSQYIALPASQRAGLDKV